MAQRSGPVSQGTEEERQLSDVDWRDLFGDEPGVYGDLDGSAYRVTLPTNSDVVQVGSDSQPSLSRVGGFFHRINAGEAEGVEIPAATGTARTDIVAVRYDPTYTGTPGPCRLVRIAGTNVGLPAYDAAPPGVEDLPLWAVTRQPGQALSQATVRLLFSRIGPHFTVPDDAPLPPSAPMGSRAHWKGIDYLRLLSGGSPVWKPLASDWQDPSTIAKRDDQGRLRAMPATASNHVPTRLQMLDGDIAAREEAKAYFDDRLANGVIPNSVALRDDTGAIFAAAATQPGHAVTKAQLDDRIRSGVWNVQTNANGDFTIQLSPAFPSALTGFTLTDASGNLGFVGIKATRGSSDRTKLTGRAFTTSGAVLANTGIAVAFTADGR